MAMFTCTDCYLDLKSGGYENCCVDRKLLGAVKQAQQVPTELKFIHINKDNYNRLPNTNVSIIKINIKNNGELDKHQNEVVF